MCYVIFAPEHNALKLYAGETRCTVGEPFEGDDGYVGSIIAIFTAHSDVEADYIFAAFKKIYPEWDC